MPSITDSIGRVLGDRYRLVTALGTGASAHVYLADDVSLHRRVAIKVLHPALAGDSAFLKRFRAEARAVAALNHPNILQVYDWGEEDGEPYLVLEYLAGGSLRQIYDTGALLTPEQAVRIGIEAARRARLRPPPRPGPPGHQAGQPALRRRRPPAHRRLRPGPGPGRGGVDRAGRGHPGHGPLRRPRTGRGLGARRQGRRLRPGPGALRRGHRRGPVHRRHHGGHPDGPGGRAPARARGPRPAERRPGVGGRPRPGRAVRRRPAGRAARATGRDPAPTRPRSPSSRPGRPTRIDRRWTRPWSTGAARPPSASTVRTSPSSACPTRPATHDRPGADELAARPNGGDRSPGRRARRRWPWVVADRRGRRRPAGRRRRLGRHAPSCSPPATRSRRWWARPWPRPSQAVTADNFHVRVTGQVYSITVAAGADRQPATRTPAPAAKPVTAKQGSTIGVVRLHRPAAGGHPRPDLVHHLHTTPSRPCRPSTWSGCARPRPPQYSSTVAAGAVARHHRRPGRPRTGRR